MDHILRELRELASDCLKEQEKRGKAKQSLRDAINAIDRVVSHLKNANYPRGDLHSEVVRIMIELGEGGAFEK